MTEFTVRHTYPIDADTFWDQVFFNPEYNRRLYLDELKFKAFEVLAFERRPDGAVTRRMRTEPAANAPAAVQKLIGDSLSYEETGRLDLASGRWVYDVVPSKMPEKVKTSGELWVEPRGPRSIERFIRTRIDVRIFGIGKMIESFVAETTKENQEKAAAFTQRWIVERNLSGQATAT